MVRINCGIVMELFCGIETRESAYESYKVATRLTRPHCVLVKRDGC